MTKRLDGKVAFMTGASSGIGAAMARDFAGRGADVVLTARRRDRLEDLAREIRGTGRQAVVAECDVTVDGDVEQAVATALDELGRIDYVIANAGFGVAGWFHRRTLDDYRRQFETNVFGVLRTAAGSMSALEATGGCLAIMGSVMSFAALPGASPYSMSKHSVRAFAEALRHEWRGRGIAVTLLAPGFVDSEIRQVDNEGEFNPEAEDPVPAWLSMDTTKAARKLVTATVRRRREKVITGHGHLAVFLSRHAPWALDFLIRRFAIQGRREEGGR
ncbi:MAG: SDR family NAD(P)-dependent oxidoreductase [Thermoanaerobaculales bacterium]|jgi:short-subunit dehydrogenase|nr:SDR family NAD(P)-dependent oxidoreductase [Thermoanaerobaculales bacterium]